MTTEDIAKFERLEAEYAEQREFREKSELMAKQKRERGEA